MQTRERRNSSRIKISSHGYANLDGKKVGLTVQDISLGGALVKLPAERALKTGMAIHLSLDIGFVGQSTVCRTVTGNGSTLYGIKFDHINHATHLRLAANILNYRDNLAKNIRQ